MPPYGPFLPFLALALLLEVQLHGLFARSHVVIVIIIVVVVVSGAFSTWLSDHFRQHAGREQAPLLHTSD